MQYYERDAKRRIDEHAVFDCSGRMFNVFEGIVGMPLDGSLVITAGHDCYPFIEEHGRSVEMVPEERCELADCMIALWEKFKVEG